MKTKKTILNFITEVIPLIIIALIGLYKSKLLISELPTDDVGLYQLFSQLLGYVTIFEFGMTGALLYRLFEPVAKKNQKQINILFYSGRKVFAIVGLMMFVIAIIFSFIIPFLIKDNPFSIGYILITFIMYILTNIIYYLVVSYKLLLEAEQKKHITNIVVQGFEILKHILELITLLIFKNLITLLSVGIITTILSSIVIIIICKKNNPELKKPVERDYSMLSDVKNLFVHKIAYLVNNNVDLIIVTKFFGLSYVVIYSTYNYIVNTLKKITSRIYVSVVPSLGNLLVEDKNKSKEVFFEMNDLMFFIAILISSSLSVSINNFIDIWYAGEIKTTFLYSLGFSLVFFSSIVVQPLTAFTDAGGCFKETRKCALLEAIINLSLSLILLKPFGIFGILFATFISYTIADNIIKSKVICSKLLNTKTEKYYIDSIIYYIIFAIIMIIDYLCLKNITISNILEWLLSSSIVFIVNLIVLVISFKLLNKNTFFNRIKYILNKRKKHKEAV